MYKSVLWIVCLLLVSTGVMATPRFAIRDGGLVGVISKEMGVPTSDTYRNPDATRHQKITNPARLGLGSPSTGNDESDVVGAGRFEAAGKPRHRSRDILAAPSAQDHAANIGGITLGNTLFDMACGLRADANLVVARPIPANIRLILPQPAAPPVINHTQES